MWPVIKRKTNKTETDPHINHILNPVDKDFKHNYYKYIKDLLEKIDKIYEQRVILAQLEN